MGGKGGKADGPAGSGGGRATYGEGGPAESGVGRERNGAGPGRSGMGWERNGLAEIGRAGAGAGGMKAEDEAEVLGPWAASAAIFLLVISIAFAMEFWIE